MMRTLLQRAALVLGATLGMGFMPATARAQKALVYCPVSVDATGCNAIVNALTGPTYPLGVDRGYDGTGGTVDLKAVDLFTYSVFVVPSLADGAESQPYAMLRDPEVAEHLKAALIGRIAMWSGSPDQGATNRGMKDALIQNLAGWAGGAFGAAKGPGLVALLDASATVGARYDWLRAITPLPVASDPVLLIYGSVRALNPRGTTILTSGMGPIAYDNMATFGFQVPNGAAGVSLDAVGQTGTSVGGQVVLLTMEAGNNDGALVHTDTNDYPPGTTVVITGSGWAPGETITLTLHEDPLVDADRVLTATTDASGNFTNTDFAPEEHDLDVRFVLTAVGQSSGRRAQTTFTDGQPQKVTLAPSSMTVAAGSSAGYSASVTMGGNSNACTITLEVITALPSGVGASFNDNPVALPNGSGSSNFSRTLTLTTTSSTPPGSYPFTVRATRGAGCQSGGSDPTESGTLVVTLGTATTTTSISSSLNPSTFGQSVTFTATVGASSGTPTGTVTFKDGLSTIGTGTLATVAGVQTATLTTSALPAGLHSMTAEYTGVAGYGPSSSGPLAQTVNKVAQVIAFTSIAPSSAVVGGPTYAVSAMGGASGNPVTFSSAAPTVCTIVGSTVSFVGTGSCVIDANQAGNTNYDAASQVSQSFAVGKGTATIVLSGLSHTYDRTAKAATATTTPSGLGVSITYAQGGNAVGSPTNAGSYDVIATITDPSYDGSTTSTLTIAPKAITGSFSADNRIYDGTISASINGRALDGVIAPDLVTLEGGTATFDSKDVGTGKSVTGVGFTLGGASAANYTLASSTLTCTADVTARGLTVTAAGVNKSYDGNATATVTLADNRVSGDVLSLAYGAASFADKNVGTTKPVSVTGISVTGADAGNYTFNTTASATADITARALTVSATGQNKVYDGTTAATVTLSDDRVAGDVFSMSYSTAAFANKNVGTGKTVSVGGIAISGTDAGNYTANTTASTTADITQRALAVTVTGENKVYDGTTAATVTFADDRVTGDVFTVSGAAAFADKNVGVAKAVNVTGIALSGADAANYSHNTTASATADITARVLTISATGQNKVYDATATATVTLSDDRVAGDALSTAYTSASFDDKNVGTNKTVNVSGISLTGADAGNYTFNTTAATSANITARPVAITAAGVDKIYDGTTTATVTLSDDRIAGDVFTASYAAATFADKNVGTDKPVSVSGISLAGADAGNYAPNTSTTTTADITPRALTVSATGIDRVYDATTVATVTLSDNRVAGDALTTSYGAAAFADKTVGNGKVVTVTGINVTGGDVGNYTFNTTAATTANITAAALTGSFTADDKVYDGSPSATILTRTVSVVLGSDVVALVGGVASFSDKNVGVAKVVTGTGFALGGADAGNYVLQSTMLTTNASITQRALSINATGVNKVYDASTTAIVNLLDNRVSGDVLTTSYAAASFADANVGVGKAVNVTGLAISGVDAPNYSANTTTSTTADITRRPLTIEADDKSMSFGSVPPAFTVTPTNFAPGEGFANLTGSLQYVTLPVNPITNTTFAGTYTITPSGVSSPNYTVTFETGTLTITDGTKPLVSNTLVPPVPIGGTVMLTSTISDELTGHTDISSAWYSINGGPLVAMSATDGAFDSAKENVKAMITAPLMTGVLSVCVTGRDALPPGNVSDPECVLLAVYDPNAGFVTGGGWIMSPAGAYVTNPSLTGKATFGFVSKYKKGQSTPDGNTEFQFHAAGMNFKSSVYEWLVVAGAKAQFKGSGTINGSGHYGFLLMAIDGQTNGGGGADKFRIKIWDMDNGNAVVYDNQIGAADTADPTTLLGGGSINIQAK